MNTKIIKKLHDRVQLETFVNRGGKKEYRIFKRSKSMKWFKTVYSDWELALQTRSLDKAIHMKHNLWMLVLGELGYRPFFLERKKTKYKRTR